MAIVRAQSPAPLSRLPLSAYLFKARVFVASLADSDPVLLDSASSVNCIYSLMGFPFRRVGLSLLSVRVTVAGVLFARLFYDDLVLDFRIPEHNKEFQVVKVQPCNLVEMCQDVKPIDCSSKGVV